MVSDNRLFDYLIQNVTEMTIKFEKNSQENL